MGKKIDVMGQLSNIKSKKETEKSTEPAPVIQQVKERKKVGRKSHKDPNKDYTKITCEIPSELFEDLQVCKALGKYPTQANLIIEALEKHIGSLKKKHNI